MTPLLILCAKVVNQTGRYGEDHKRAHSIQEIRKRINICAAMNQEKKDSRPHKMKSRCSKSWEVLSDKEDMLSAHFCELSKSRIGSDQGLQQLAKCLEMMSISNEDEIYTSL